MKMGDAVLRVASRAAVCLTAGLLVSCAGGGDKAKPAELATNASKLGVRLAWTARVGAVNFPLDIAVASVNTANSAAINIASGDGVVASFDAA